MVRLRIPRNVRNPRSMFDKREDLIKTKSGATVTRAEAQEAINNSANNINVKIERRTSD